MKKGVSICVLSEDGKSISHPHRSDWVPTFLYHRGNRVPFFPVFLDSIFVAEKIIAPSHERETWSLAHNALQTGSCLLLVTKRGDFVGVVGYAELGMNVCNMTSFIITEHWRGKRIGTLLFEFFCHHVTLSKFVTLFAANHALGFWTKLKGLTRKAPAEVAVAAALLEASADKTGKIYWWTQ